MRLTILHRGMEVTAVVLCVAGAAYAMDVGRADTVQGTLRAAECVLVADTSPQCDAAAIGRGKAAGVEYDGKFTFVLVSPKVFDGLCSSTDSIWVSASGIEHDDGRALTPLTIDYDCGDGRRSIRMEDDR